MNTIILCAFFISPPPANAQQRDAMFGKTVHNENAYIQDSAAFKYAENKFVHHYFKKHAALLQMNSVDDSLYQNFYSALESGNTGLFGQVNDFIHQGNTSAAFSLNSSCLANCIMEANTKIVNDVYLRSWAIGKPDFNPADSSELYNIAMQNPLLGGNGVYGARVMLGIDPDQNNNRIIFSDEAVSITEKGNTSFGNIYPNPNTGSMQLDYELKQDEKGQLIIYDAIGQKISSYDLFEGVNSLSISEHALKNGIYFYEIKINGEIIESKKIVIIK